MTTATIALPPKLIPVFSGEYRYRGAYGGRGSAKTRSFALMTAVRGYMFSKAGVSGVILCGREFMNSLSDSSMEEVKQAIRSVPWLNDFYEMGEEYIRSKDRRISYIFSGLRHNLDSIKSKARILIAWVDEAESVSEKAWEKLIPTVREDGSEIWVTWNPEKRGSATDKRFRGVKDPGMCVVQLNYQDNPWFPAVLEEDRQRDRIRLDPEKYAWIWDGAYLESTEACVFKDKFEVNTFDVGSDWDGPYQGLDFGFSQDPTAAVRSYIHDGFLYIRHEAVKVGLEIDDTSSFINQKIDRWNDYASRADNARPESISYLKRHGMHRVQPCLKGKGSVEDGIAFIKSFKKVIIHPDCTHTINEFKNYSYKTDRLTGDVLPDLVDANNHIIDALRYALEPIMKRKRGFFG